MLILVSQDFFPFAQALEQLYAEPIINFVHHSNWLHNLVEINSGKFISRISIIGHSDSFYGEDQSFFGGNLSERVMLIDEFIHALMTLIKYNERLKPGFCRHLKHIDLIDCHIGERKFIAQMVAKQFHDDDYLGEYGAHIKISSFAHSHHLKNGTALVMHPEDSQLLSFYSFHSAKAFLDYKNVHQKLSEMSNELHHLEQMPGHTAVLPNGKSREKTIEHLEKQCQNLDKKKQELLQEHTDKVIHIADPRQYLDHHKACQITVADATYKPAFIKKKSSTKLPKHKDHFFAKNACPNPKHTSHLDHHHNMHTSKHPAEEELHPQTTEHKVPRR
jgi:hypothetical protein